MGLLQGIRQKGAEHVCCSAWRCRPGSAGGELCGEGLRENRVFLFLPAEAPGRQNSDGLDCTHTCIYRYNGVFGNLNMTKIYLYNGLTSPEMQYCNYVKI